MLQASELSFPPSWSTFLCSTDVSKARNLESLRERFSVRLTSTKRCSLLPLPKPRFLTTIKLTPSLHPHSTAAVFLSSPACLLFAWREVKIEWRALVVAAVPWMATHCRPNVRGMSADFMTAHLWDGGGYIGREEREREREREVVAMSTWGEKKFVRLSIRLRPLPLPVSVWLSVFPSVSPVRLSVHLSIRLRPLPPLFLFGCLSVLLCLTDSPCHCPTSVCLSVSVLACFSLSLSVCVCVRARASLFPPPPPPLSLSHSLRACSIRTQTCGKQGRFLLAVLGH